MIVNATIIDPTNANVLVNASGRKSLPSAPVIVKTGRKLTMVVATAVTTALPTSEEAWYTTSSVFVPSGASSRRRRMFSQMMMPISTMVPMAMAIPLSATMLASTPTCFIAIKHIRIARGSSAPIRTLLRRCTTITMTTMIVTSTSSVSAA